MEKYLKPLHPEYKRALDIALEEGPKKFLDQFREFVSIK
jgi:hypothetical protein